MKKYLFILTLILLTSCNIEKVENPKRATTFEILDLPRDSTLVPAFDKIAVYLINKESNTVEYILTGNDNDTILITAMLFFILGIFLGFLMFK